MTNVPIALIIFNRPQYTRLVLDNIKKAKPTKLYVIADGPKNEDDKEKCSEARAIIDKIDWDCQVFKNYSDTNMGCKERVSSGISWAFKNEQELIILEDDCLPDESFFYFAEELLSKYKNDERIMMITGSNPVPDYKIENSYLFSRYFSIWGWATWKRAWEKYDSEMKDWPRLKKEKWLKNFYHHRGLLQFLNLLFDQAYSNEIDSWVTRWFYSCLRNNGLCIAPATNIVSNIGIEGIHSSPGSNNNVPLVPLKTSSLKHPILIKQDKIYDNTFFNKSFPYYCKPLELFIKSKLLVIKLLVKIKKIFRKMGLVE